jgi:hypothetical protein
MSGSDHPLILSSLRLSWRRLFASVLLVSTSAVAMTSGLPASAAVVPSRTDLRVLVLDDNSAWVDAIQSELSTEGVLFTSVPLASPTRPVITDAFLSSGSEAFYQAVVAPSYLLSDLTPAESTSLRTYEANFGIREVDAYNWANPAVGLNYAGITGDINGTVATVTPAGLAGGFGYLNGPVPFSAGSWSYIAEPLAAASLPAGSSYTTLLGAPLPGGVTGSLIGVYSNAGVEQLVITAAFSVSLPQFKYVAHGIVSWATRGVHFGYNRNNFTFHVDDAFNSDSSWNTDLNCTPGEDCTGPEASARMTPADVTYAVNWEKASGYQLTLAFNGFYADPVADPLTQAFQTNASAFRWLNHGFEHIYQGCVQNFTVAPWQCTLDANGQIVWETQANIYNEINNNINLGHTLGLSFDPTEYLSGEHSGLFFLPQQPTDNPNFAAALTQAGILHIASDASRDNVARQVGTAVTIPRHPTALYYNTSTQAQAVDEYNWLYNSRANGGSGYCEDNPTTATCIAPLDPATGFTSYIVPTDAAYDLNFILSNDPRPFYAHTSNLTGDRLAYNLLDAILGKYNAAFTSATPLVNMTLTQASNELLRQTQWAATGAPNASGYVQNGQITITNPAGVAVPFTAPTGTTVNGSVLQPYGGEVSAWLAPGSTTGSLPGAVSMTVTGSTAFVVGATGTVNIATTGVPAATISVAGALPTGVTFSAAPGTGTITGIPAAGTGGSYPLTITAGNGISSQTQTVVITVAQAPQFTSAASATAIAGTPFSFAITTTGVPAATLTRAGTLPTGITFTAGANGTATLSGTASAASAGHSYPMTLTATNSAAAVTQAFTLLVGAPNNILINVTGSAAFRVGTNSTINITAVGVPTPTVSLTGALPTGVSFSAGSGTGVITGTPAAGTGGSYPVTITARSGTLVRTQQLVITVAQSPAFTSAASASASAGSAFSFNITTTGYPASTITRSGTLPTGVTFTAGANGTARLSGTPSTAMAGRTFPITFTATSSSGVTSQSFTLTVGRAPTITSGTLAFPRIGRSFSFTVQTTGTPTASITIAGALPAGLTFVDNHNGTARISGTPTRNSGRTYSVVVSAQNIYGSTSKTLTLMVF